MQKSTGARISPGANGAIRYTAKNTAEIWQPAHGRAGHGLCSQGRMLTQTPYSDRQLLISLLIQGIVEAEERLNRVPTRAEVLEQLFPDFGDEPEALALGERLNELLGELIAEWFERYDEWQD